MSDMKLNEALEIVKTAAGKLEAQEYRWSIVLLDRGWVFVGKLSYDESGSGVLTNAANIRRWGTTAGLGEIQHGPTSKTVLDPCPLPVRFSSCILTFDVSEEGWAHVY